MKTSGLVSVCLDPVEQVSGAGQAGSSRILTLAWSVRRWLTSSPTRLTTPFDPLERLCRRPLRGRLPGVTVGPRVLQPGQSGWRVRRTTSSPRASRASQTAEPIIRLAPVTRTRIRRVMLTAPRCSVSADAPSPDAPSPLTISKVARSPPRRASRRRAPRPRRGHPGRDITVEDRGDDVVLREVVLGDDLGDPAGGGELHLLGDSRRARVEGARRDPREAEDVVDLVQVVEQPVAMIRTNGSASSAAPRGSGSPSRRRSGRRSSSPATAPLEPRGAQAR